MSTLATWFTPSLQTISRSSGRSAVAAAAYRACAEIYDFRTGITHDFTPKAMRGLATNIFVGIPNNDISKLWNDAERAEIRSKATVARELMLPLPSDWDDWQRASCTEDIANMIHGTYDVAVMASIHRPGRNNKNDHAHILFTTRTVDANGNFGKKTRILDDLKTGEVKRLREAVATIVNTHAQKNGNDWFVTAGKYAEHIKNHIPTHHISITHGKQQKKFIDLNRADVAEARNELSKLQKQIDDIDEKVARLTEIKEKQVEDADTKIIAANEHRIKEVALNYADWLKASNDLMGSLERTNANMTIYEERKKELIKDWGQEEWDKSMTAFKEDIADETDKLNTINIKLKDPVTQVLYVEYQKRLNAALTPLEKAKAREKSIVKDLTTIQGRILKGEALGLWEPDSQLTCEQKREELLIILNNTQIVIWDLTPEDERSTIMEPAPPAPYTNAQLDAMPCHSFENYQDIRERVEETRLKRNAMVDERGCYIKNEWHI